MISDAFNITPSDTATLTVRPRKLWVGGAGTVNMLCSSSKTVTFNCPAGTLLYASPRLVFSTGTTATNIVGIVEDA